MRVPSKPLALLTLTAAAASLTFSPASACEWGKTAKAKPKMTVAAVQDLSDVAIATNDLPKEMTEAQPVLPKPKSGAAD